MELWKWLLLGAAVAALVLAAPRGASDRPAVEVERPAFVAHEVTFGHAEATLAGTLTIPVGQGPYPGLVLISGSGPQNRDEELAGVPGYRPFRWIAEYLSSRGLAVLRYDDRGVGRSTGDATTATTEDLSTDAEAALACLAARREVDAGRVGLLGHSEGATVAAMVAARNDRAAFVVSLAGPAVDGHRLTVRQVERILLASGADPEVAAAAAAQQRQILDMARSGDWEALETRLVEISRAQLAALPPEEREAMGDLDQAALAAAADQLASLQSPWYQFYLAYDPSEDWAQVTVPVLAVFGGLDVQVDVEQNKQPLLAALAGAGNSDVTVVVLPDANHLFQPAVTGGVQEYATLPATFVPRLLPTIGDWILARTGQPSPGDG
ncbi:MAG: alpha/beta hydrolase family protein [Candidatus Bipolaricaulaceae bacterium]